MKQIAEDLAHMDTLLARLQAVRTRIEALEERLNEKEVQHAKNNK